MPTVQAQTGNFSSLHGRQLLLGGSIRVRQLTSLSPKKPAITMSITDARLNQIKENEEEIEELVKWISEEQKKLEEQESIAENVPDEVLNLISESASSSTTKRGKGEANSVKESAERNKEVIQSMKNSIREKEARLERLRAEKRDLEAFVRGD